MMRNEQTHDDISIRPNLRSPRSERTRDVIRAKSDPFKYVNIHSNEKRIFIETDEKKREEAKKVGSHRWLAHI